MTTMENDVNGLITGIFERMGEALKRGKGVRLDNDELYLLSLSIIGEVMLTEREVSQQNTGREKQSLA